MKQILFRLFENLKQLGIKPNIGSRTNVTPIRGSEIDRLINKPVTPKEFDYSKPEVVDSMKSIVQNASDYVGQFTERQLKTFNDNVERILGVIKPKENVSEVIDITTKEKITGPGLESLMREKGVAPISRKTIEAETLIKQFLDDDLISLNAKQIDQLSRGRAEDVFENIFGSKAKELITGKNTNESLNEVYNKLKTTKDTRGRLPDDPNFDPSDINFKDGGSVSEDVKKLLKEEFIELINADPESFPDTNAGFRRFLKRKGAPVFNYKDGGEVKEPKQTDAEIEEEIRENKKELLGKRSILDLYKGNTLFGLDLDFADKNIGGEFGQYNKKDIKDPRIGLSIIPNVQDDTSSRWGISIGPKGGGITFMKPFSEELIDEENISSKMTDEELIQNYINFAKNVWGTKVTEDEARKTLGIYKIPDTNVRDLIIPKMKKGGRVKEKAEEPLSKYKSYSENELLSSLDAKMPNLEIIDDELITIPIFEPRDIVPKGARPVMPSEEYLRQRLFLDLAKGGRVKKRKRYADGGMYWDSARNSWYDSEGGPNKTYDPTLGGWVSNLSSTGASTPTTIEVPTIDPFSGQQVSLQEAISLAEQMTPPTPAAGYTEEGLRKISEDTASRVNAVIDAFNAGLYNQTPTVDPFSGQQVSAQDQLAFTQPQADIFPTINVGSSDPLTNILGSQVGNLSYSEMNALRNRSPNVLSSNVGANLLQALGTGLKDFAYVGDKLGPDYYKNLSGNFFENVKNLDKGFAYDPTYVGADKTGRLDYYKQGIKSLLGINTPGSNVGGGTPGMRYAIEQISPYLSKTVGPVLNVLGSAPVTAFGILDTLTGPANAPEVGKGPEYFRQQLQLPENSPVSRFNQVQDPRAMMAYGGLTKTIPPVRGPNPQGVESLFKKRYN